MLLAQVVGTVNATVKQPALDGQTVLCVEPRDETWRPTGEPSFLALDNGRTKEIGSTKDEDLLSGVRGWRLCEATSG